MRDRSRLLWVLLAAALAAAGCGERNIVRASPPSVTTPPPEAKPATPAESKPPAAEPKLETPPESTPTTQPVAPPPAKRPVTHPKPAQQESTEPPAQPPSEPKPAPPEISPELTPQQQADAERHTSADMAQAEQTLQSVAGKQLNPAQQDLVDKIKGFLDQAHEAIHANDWIRAQNLAQKARVLAAELVKPM